MKQDSGMFIIGGSPYSPHPYSSPLYKLETNGNQNKGSL